MRRPYDPSADVWTPWTTERVAAAIDGTGAWFSGGQGLDMWLGRVTRAHSDIDVSVTRNTWHTLTAALRTELTFFRAESGWLSELHDGIQEPPVNTWCADSTGRWCLQINLEAGDTAGWRYRRDERVTRPWDATILTVEGVPVMAPEVQLLWKSCRPSPKDEADWAAVLPALDDASRDWLRAAVRLAHPESPMNRQF
jgi:hypothetical protein